MSCCVMKSHAVEGKSGNRHDCCAGKGHAVEGKSSNRHDRGAGKGHAVEGKSGNRHDRGAGKGHAVEGKSGNRHDSRRVAHAKKKKARNGVCGAAPASSKLPRRTRQKEKSKK